MSARPGVPSRRPEPTTVGHRRRWPGLCAALMLACAPGILPGTAAAREGIGRLFFTPAQRAQLDHARRQPIAPEPVRDAGGLPAPPHAQWLAVDGIVRRSDGQSTVWINRTPTPAPQTRGTVPIGPVGDASDGADLHLPHLPHGGQRVRIKVGQEIDMQSGRIRERYRQPPAADPGRAEPPDDAPRAADPAR